MSETQTNGIDATVAKRWVGDIKAKFDELDSERGSYMSRCKGIRDQIKEMKEAAQNAGIPRRGLNHLLKRHVLEGKLSAHEDEAEEEVVETADMIDFALGGDKGLAGSPLAAAAGGKKEQSAAKSTARRGKKSAALDSLAGGEDEPDLCSADQKNREAERQAADALKGIKHLPPAAAH